MRRRANLGALAGTVVLLGVFATIPGLEPREQSKAATFIQSFFNDLDSGRIFKNCLG